jgi:hypothetical protein
MNVQPRWPAMVRNASYLNWEFLGPLRYGLCTNHTPTSGRNVRNLVGTVGTISQLTSIRDFEKTPCHYYLCGIASLKCLERSGIASILVAFEARRDVRNRITKYCTLPYLRTLRSEGCRGGVWAGDHSVMRPSR